MEIAIYSSGPKAGNIATTADAIRGYPQGVDAAFAALGINPKSLPKSLRAAIRRSDKPQYPVTYLSPTLDQTNQAVNLKQEKFSPVKSIKPLLSERFTIFKGDGIARLGEYLEQGSRFNIDYRLLHTGKMKSLQSEVVMQRGERGATLKIEPDLYIPLVDLAELILTPLN